jgi:hypothetical protein
MDPIPLDPSERAWQEVLRQCPPTTPARGAARRKADLAMSERYAGNHVAYIDTWTGDELERTVVAVAAEVADFQNELSQLPLEVRQRVVCTYLTPADVISAPSARIGG